MFEFNRAERRALALASALIVAGAAARAGLGPGPAAYSWQPAGMGSEAPAASLAGVRGAVDAAVAREEAAARPLQPDERLDPNAAPEEELRRLAGIGPARARAIVDGRRQGPYRSLEDLLRVPGIGEATLARIAPHLTLAGGDPTTLPAGLAVERVPPADAGFSLPGVPGSRRVDLNAAGLEELEGLPWVGPVRARQILEVRRRRGGFRSVDELVEVPGIGARTVDRLREFVYVR